MSGLYTENIVRMEKRKTILITGATSGFGLSIANRLHTDGHIVIGTSRDSSKLSDSHNFELITLDVTSADSVSSCFESLFHKIETLDILINNAGIAIVGSIEETTIEQARLQFETNFWGNVRVNNAVLPVFRRQGFGHIICIGSLAGLIGVPFQGYYSASKHSLEGYMKSLKYEVEPFGIKLSLIEPGFFKTNLHNAFVYAEKRIEDYNPAREKVYSTLKNAIESASSPDILADKISKIITKKNPKFKYRVGTDAKFLPIVDFIFPKLFETGLKSKFKLK
jgi:short-subunit dehydrogenase